MLLYKFRSLERLEFLADILVNQRLYCPCYYEMNDPFEGVAKAYRLRHPQSTGRFISTTTVDDLLDPEDCIEARLCSLSASLDDVRLWSYYGGGHRGVAIEIEFAETEVAKIRYGPSLLEYDEDAHEQPSATGLLCYKTDHWKFEDEYRLFRTEKYCSVKGRIRRIIAGPRCRHEDLQLLERLAPTGVPVIRTELDNASVKVKLKITTSGGTTATGISAAGPGGEANN
jgi:hypothetical protein